ncbi:MAG: ASPIC/UnbV domain-containing protein, partial [bacterium]
LLVTSNNGAVRLLRNDSKRAKGHTSIRIRLKGKGANTQGIGAEVTLTTPLGQYRRSLRAGEGYLTGGPGELLFGLGACKGPIDAHVRWPSGTETEHTDLLVGGLVVLSEE